MAEKTKKLVLKSNAPDEVEIAFGMEFKRKFKRSSEPFTVETRYAKVLLGAGNFEEFTDKPETKPEVKPEAKPETKK